MIDKININSRKQKIIIYIILTLATLAVFWQVNNYDFINIDDPVYVVENMHVHSGITWDGIRWAFGIRNAEYWYPLARLSWMLDYQLYGLNAGGYHLTNLILHIMSTLLIFWLFNRMTGAVWKSAFVAAFFALHPLHVESVAWISERKDVLSAFFWMLTLCLYIYYTEKPVIKRYLLVLFSFTCALMCKSMVVTLPLVMILLDYWPLDRFQSKKDILILWQLREKIPFFILSAVLSIITVFSSHTMAVQYFSYPLLSRIANALVSFMIYLGKTFWPQDMAIFYPFPTHIPVWQVWGATLLIIAISAAIIVMARRLPYLLVGWSWYVITIAPVIGIIQFSSQAMADRFIYLPSIGISIMLAWGAPLLLKSKKMRKKILFPAAIAFLIIMSVLTWKQCGYWKNSIELSKNTLQATKNNFVAHNCLAAALAAEGKTEEAIHHYNEAIRMYPGFVIAYNNRGKAYSDLGRKERALEDYNRAIRLEPDYAEAYYNRGTIYIESGQYQNAVQDYNETIRIKPDYIRAYYNRGIAYSKLGQYQMAINDYNKIIHLKTDYADAYNNRGAVYLNLGKNELGCRDAKKACELGVCNVLEIAKRQRDCP